jgi:hypothetical protein
MLWQADAIYLPALDRSSSFPSCHLVFFFIVPSPILFISGKMHLQVKALIPIMHEGDEYNSKTGHK